MKEARNRGAAGRDGHQVVVGGEPPAYPLWFPAPGTLAFGCGCVALLGLAAVLKVGVLEEHLCFLSAPHHFPVDILMHVYKHVRASVGIHQLIGPI